jgi:hypothetical protein
VEDFLMDNKIEWAGLGIESSGVDIWKLKSSLIEQEYQVWVSLPAGYAKDSHPYPVLYLLDADATFGLARDILGLLSLGEEIQKLILVGIAYGEGQEAWWQKRSRDLTPTQDQLKTWGDWPLAGGANLFLRFIEEELIPSIETHYQADPSNRALAGFSFGGLFAGFSLLQTQRKFQNYIIVSPAILWDAKLLIKLEEEYSITNAALPARVYFAIGELEDATTLLEPFKDFALALKNRGYQGLETSDQIMPGETHFSAFSQGLTRGLRFLFPRS